MAKRARFNVSSFSGAAVAPVQTEQVEVVVRMGGMYMRHVLDLFIMYRSYR